MLGDLYENLYEQQTTFNQQYTERVDNIETQLEGISINVIPHPPPPPPLDTSNAPPRPPYYVTPY